MKESWTQIELEIHPALMDAVSNFLIEEGSPGVMQEGVSGLGGRKRERLVAYFPVRRPIRLIRKRIRAYVAELCKRYRSSFAMREKRIVDPGWGEAWKAHFKPARITSRLVIKPPWERIRPREDDVVIEIDPGMAFGTGSHPTTRMCLQVLEELISDGQKIRSVLDVGTGSGILAIAARKMGVLRVWAVDTDPAAIAAARKNAARNGVRSGIQFQVGSLGGVRRHFDLLLVNLLPQELRGLIPSLAKRVSAGGFVVVSGFLRRQKKEIREAMENAGLEPCAARSSKEWSAFVLRPAERR